MGGVVITASRRAAAIRTAHPRRGIRITELEHRQLERIPAQLAMKVKQEATPAVKTPATPQRIPSKE